MFRRTRLSTAILAASTLGVSTAYGAIEEMVVTATKRKASTQDIPVAVKALDSTTLTQLGVANFEDYLVQLAGVTAGGSGPGQNTIYIRGAASTTPNLTTAGVAGLAPNVALYLDDQPVSQPGRNLDVYVADMARVEVLSGPQGTLFGGSSQAGLVRLITNKPDPSGTYATVKLSTSFTSGGEPSQSAQGVLNMPVSSRLALRGVVYVDNQGGYIDNVQGTRSLAQSGRFRPAGTVRANGVPVNADRAGFQAGANVNGVTFRNSDNAARVEDDFNETTYSGMRLSGRFSITDDWTLQAAYMTQSLDAEGVFFADPGLGDYQIQRWQDDTMEDSFTNVSWTVDGRVGGLELLYTGAYTNRATDQLVDYSDYLFVGQYLPYYLCDSSVSYPADNVDPAGLCRAPDMYVKSRTRVDMNTHELRVATSENNRLRLTAGAFFSNVDLTERSDFGYPGTRDFGPSGPFKPNYPFKTGYFSDPGPFPAGVIFRNDVLRTDKQLGLFGEVSFDLTQKVALTMGARYYNVDVDLKGSANSSFCNSAAAADTNSFGTDISDLYNGDGQITDRGTCDPAEQITYTQQTIDQAPDRIQNALRNAPDSAQESGVIGKASLSLKPTDNMLWYLTWSQGFRSGLLNRPGGAVAANGFTVPFELHTDDVVNYELGWKLDLLNQTLRFNGSAFFVQISDMQTTILDPAISNLFFSDNAANARIRGIEGDFIWSPVVSPGLSVFGSFSLLDTKITKVLTPTTDVRKGDKLAFAPSFQGTLRGRYQWQIPSAMTAHAMLQLIYSGSATSDVITINRDQMDSWLLVGSTVGVSRNDWVTEVFVENLFNKQAELARNYVFDVSRVTYARPRTVGLRVRFGF